MKLKKIITMLTISVTISATGVTFVNFYHPNSVKAFSIGLKKGIPSQFKRSWMSKVTSNDDGDGYSADFIIRKGDKYQFITSYWDQNGKNEPNNDTISNAKLKYSLKVSKQQYLIATKVTDRKNLLLVKFTSKHTMKYSLAEVNKNGKLYRTSDNSNMKAAPKATAKNKATGDLKISNADNDSNDNNN